MFKDLLRLLKIINTFLKARLDVELQDWQHSKMVAFLLFISPWRLYSPQGESGERLRNALEELGPIFIKFGQLLSTRPDILPSDIASDLKALQDDLPPFSEQEALKIIERELGADINEVFEDFDARPLAAASIAQVHTAKLKDIQQQVVLKVVRPRTTFKTTCC